MKTRSQKRIDILDERVLAIERQQDITNYMLNGNGGVIDRLVALEKGSVGICLFLSQPLWRYQQMG